LEAIEVVTNTLASKKGCIHLAFAESDSALFRSFLIVHDLHGSKVSVYSPSSIEERAKKERQEWKESAFFIANDHVTCCYFTSRTHVVSTEFDHGQWFK